MTAIIVSHRPADPGVYRFDLISTLRVGWRAMRRHREAHRILVALSRKPPRLLRDMGIDPERLYETLDGTFDEVGPAHLSRLLRSHGET
ncbi:DUF1127 domain-containing protein [Aureimonas pseudogalii]|uniref:Uncharacterized protein YjiS (DUF1127 family) n=1 Tax=Aureimonas pseudogalii TaxID=1744844 RepID=A0A7W6MME0_9HYPH|nr:DUF1127 domain-containing protein [Aureimonas pseudogalii]MBB4000750.1 uncharacterized protein YjiS (DUF1127 family) [Aureimonas pseudogalii]